MSTEKIFERILSGSSDANISFSELCKVVEALALSGQADEEHYSEIPPYHSSMSKYEIIIYWSEEDQLFLAEVPELPGCVADGDTSQQALANAEIVIREWIETAKELGRSIPAPKGRLIFA